MFERNADKYEGNNPRGLTRSSVRAWYEARYEDGYRLTGKRLRADLRSMIALMGREYSMRHETCIEWLKAALSEGGYEAAREATDAWLAETDAEYQAVIKAKKARRDQSRVKAYKAKIKAGGIVCEHEIYPLADKRWAKRVRQLHGLLSGKELTCTELCKAAHDQLHFHAPVVVNTLMVGEYWAFRYNEKSYTFSAAEWSGKAAYAAERAEWHAV